MRRNLWQDDLPEGVSIRKIRERKRGNNGCLFLAILAIGFIVVGIVEFAKEFPLLVLLVLAILYFTVSRIKTK